MGLGFVGAVMAAVVADAEDGKGNPTKFVIGMQRPSTRSFWKIPLINLGRPPVSSEDPEVAPMIDRCVNKKKTLTATFTYDALKFADVVIVDIQCDYLKESLGNVRDGRAERKARGRVVKFRKEVIHTDKFPLTVLDRPIESETAKIVENSFRATILAFLDEWSLFAERNGVDLIKVINAIKVRPTHSNIIFPGPGIGGYCLPKDGGLGMWAYKHILGWEDNIFKITPTAININHTRAWRVGQLTRDALRNMDRPVASAEVLVLGASYREDVGDTRYSGSELIVRRLTEMGAELRVHDPYFPDGGG